LIPLRYITLVGGCVVVGTLLLLIVGVNVHLVWLLLIVIVCYVPLVVLLILCCCWFHCYGCRYIVIRAALILLVDYLVLLLLLDGYRLLRTLPIVVRVLRWCYYTFYVTRLIICYETDYLLLLFVIVEPRVVVPICCTLLRPFRIDYARNSTFVVLVVYRLLLIDLLRWCTVLVLMLFVPVVDFLLLLTLLLCWPRCWFCYVTLITVVVLLFDLILRWCCYLLLFTLFIGYWLLIYIVTLIYCCISLFPHWCVVTLILIVVIVVRVMRCICWCWLLLIDVIMRCCCCYSTVVVWLHFVDTLLLHFMLHWLLLLLIATCYQVIVLTIGTGVICIVDWLFWWLLIWWLLRCYCRYLLIVVIDCCCCCYEPLLLHCWTLLLLGRYWLLIVLLLRCLHCCGIDWLMIWFVVVMEIGIVIVYIVVTTLLLTGLPLYCWQLAIYCCYCWFCCLLLLIWWLLLLLCCWLFWWWFGLHVVLLFTDCCIVVIPFYWRFVIVIFVVVVVLFVDWLRLSCWLLLLLLFYVVTTLIIVQLLLIIVVVVTHWLPFFCSGGLVRHLLLHWCTFVFDFVTRLFCYFDWSFVVGYVYCTTLFYPHCAWFVPCAFPLCMMIVCCDCVLIVCHCALLILLRLVHGDLLLLLLCWRWCCVIDHCCDYWLLLTFRCTFHTRSDCCWFTCTFVIIIIIALLLLLILVTILLLMRTRHSFDCYVHLNYYYLHVTNTLRSLPLFCYCWFVVLQLITYYLIPVIWCVVRLNYGCTFGIAVICCCMIWLYGPHRCYTVVITYGDSVTPGIVTCSYGCSGPVDCVYVVHGDIVVTLLLWCWLLWYVVVVVVDLFCSLFCYVVVDVNWPVLLYTLTFYLVAVVVCWFAFYLLRLRYWFVVVLFWLLLLLLIVILRVCCTLISVYCYSLLLYVCIRCYGVVVVLLITRCSDFVDVVWFGHVVDCWLLLLLLLLIVVVDYCRGVGCVYHIVVVVVVGTLFTLFVRLLRFGHWPHFPHSGCSLCWLIDYCWLLLFLSRCCCWFIDVIVLHVSVLMTDDCYHCVDFVRVIGRCLLLLWIDRSVLLVIMDSVPHYWWYVSPLFRLIWLFYDFIRLCLFYWMIIWCCCSHFVYYPWLIYCGIVICWTVIVGTLRFWRHCLIVTLLLVIVVVAFYLLYRPRYCCCCVTLLFIVHTLLPCWCVVILLLLLIVIGCCYCCVCCYLFRFAATRSRYVITLLLIYDCSHVIDWLWNDCYWLFIFFFFFFVHLLLLLVVLIYCVRGGIVVIVALIDYMVNFILVDCELFRYLELWWLLIDWMRMILHVDCSILWFVVGLHCSHTVRSRYCGWLLWLDWIGYLCWPVCVGALIIVDLHLFTDCGCRFITADIIVLVYAFRITVARSCVCYPFTLCCTVPILCVTHWLHLILLDYAPHTPDFTRCSAFPVHYCCTLFAVRCDWLRTRFAYCTDFTVRFGYLCSYFDDALFARVVTTTGLLLRLLLLTVVVARLLLRFTYYVGTCLLLLFVVVTLFTVVVDSFRCCGCCCCCWLPLLRLLRWLLFDSLLLLFCCCYCCWLLLRNWQLRCYALIVRWMFWLLLRWLIVIARLLLLHLLVDSTLLLLLLFTVVTFVDGCVGHGYWLFDPLLLITHGYLPVYWCADSSWLLIYYHCYCCYGYLQDAVDIDGSILWIVIVFNVVVDYVGLLIYHNYFTFVVVDRWLTLNCCSRFPCLLPLLICCYWLQVVVLLIDVDCLLFTFVVDCYFRWLLFIVRCC